VSALVKVPHGTICSGGTGEVHRHSLLIDDPSPGQAPQPPSSDLAPVARLVVVNFGYSQIELDDALEPSSLPSSFI
tara:strand:- start:377 stop:604 length:228 start_codon:yes stop_codon:yes gene_type:complete